MNVISKTCKRQVPILVLAAVLILLNSCGFKKSENIIRPPASSPLSRTVIGFGVINVSYSQLKTEPETSGISHGFLRHGSIVKILERREINTGRQIERWVLAEGNYQGWLREEVVDIYDNELQARTAAEFLSQ